MPSDEDRVAYLAGDATDALDPAEQAELDELKTLLGDPAVWADPDPGVEDRVVAAITAEAALTTDAPDAVAPRPASRTREPATVTPLAPRRSRRPLVYALAGVAAAALIALGVVVALRRDTTSPQFTVALQPSNLIPDAFGTAEMTKSTSGWRIELDATGLPRLDGGRFYEAWLRNAANVLVPIGTFNEGADVTLWAGVSPLDFPTMTITREEADGNQASSGQRVLVGTVKNP
jgi:hypothetical protein